MDEVFTRARNAMISTLEDANMIGVEASKQRIESAFGAGVLQSALDAAVSANAENSLEKMLCHQLAAPITCYENGRTCNECRVAAG